MAITSTRLTVIGLTSDDLNTTDRISAAANGASPGQSQQIRLASGANTITIPDAGTTPVCATIIMPVGNTHLVTLKGITGDTGVALHKTDPTSIAIDSTVATFVLTAAAQVDIRIVWT